MSGEGGTLPNGKQRVSGIDGPVDLNEYNGTEAELRSKYCKQSVVKPETTPEQKQIRVVYETTAGTGYLIGDITYVAVTALADVFRFTVGFDNSGKAAVINGRKLQDTKLIDGKAYVQVRPLVKAFGGVLVWDNDNKKLTVAKGNN